MQLILISREDYFVGEADIVNSLFEAGLPRLHIRKPGSSQDKLAELLRGIDKKYYPRIVLHDCFGLVMDFGLGGVHLNSRNPLPPKKMESWMTVSRSCHTFDEIRKYKSECDYLTLSPIFNSISKKGYKSSWTLEDIRNSEVADAKVIALGGITEEKISIVKELGFGGVAILGEIWNAQNKQVKMRRLCALCASFKL